MSRPTNRTELRVIGMSRSGNHAIINWIRRQAQGRVCFLNCAEPRTNPFRSCRPLASGRRAVANYRPFRLRQEAAGDLSEKDWLIHSYEDCFLTSVAADDFELCHDAWVGTSGHRVNALILRDPFNLFASRMTSRFGGVTPNTAVRIWKQHARQFCGERTILPRPTVAISYNRWAFDQEYRRQIAAQLGLRFSDRGFGRVPATGGGSSFEGRVYDGRAAEMPILQRWKRIRKDACYRALFDDEIVRLARKIFDLDPALRSFARQLTSRRGLVHAG